MRLKHIWSSGIGCKRIMMALLLIVVLLVPEAYFSLQPGTAEASETQVLGDLQIGDRVVDLSWEWEFKTGANYSGTGETKPVTWIVVAKDHYGVGSGVTLLAEELIGLYCFDNSTDRGDDDGSNHWGDSGTPNATHGLRPWLNSSGIHSTEGLYLAFSESFKVNIITTNVPNKEWEGGDPYITQDRVFIPSSTELGDSVHESTYEVGTVYPYFTGAVNADRIAELGGTAKNYWTRSPDSRWTEHVKQVGTSGAISNFFALSGYNAVRPALNLSEDFAVSSEPNNDGAYLLLSPTQSLGNLNIGDRVVDLSWKWEFKTDRNYTGTGETKAVVWIVVAKDHYKMSPGVTLISEELIGCYTFDNSPTDGSNHWGNSGTGKETRGLRPWLNSTGTHTGEGFFQAFSDKFKDAIVITSVPNKEWERGMVYTTMDQVFIPSTTELGDAAHIDTYEIGTAYPYFSGSTNRDRIAQLGGISQAYWTRSPDNRSAENVRRISTSGSFDTVVARDGYGAVRPVVTLFSEVRVSETADVNGVYMLFGEFPLYGDVNGDGKIDVGDAILLLRHIVGLIDIEAEFGPDALTRAKVSGNEGAVDVGDAILILRYIVGLITAFPVEG